MVTVKTATFRHGNTSFSITGPLRFCDGPNPSALADDVAGTVLVADYDAYGNSFAWARACQSRGCIGVVMLTRVNPTITSLDAWVETDRAASRNEQISAVPLVIIDGNDALTSMEDVRRLAGPVIATMDSSDIMDGTSASVAFGSAGVTAAFVVAWLVNVVNMAAAVYKFAAFAIDREGNLRAIPPYPCIVFSTALVSSTLRMLWFADAAFYSLQSFSRVFYRILITLFIPIGFAGTAAIGMAMHDHLKQGKTVSMQHKVTVYSLLSVLGIVFTVDIVGTFVAAVTWHEYFDVTYLSSFYFLMNFPVSVLFIKYGIAVSNALLKNDNISTVERARSLQFARRVIVSGVVGVVLLLSQVLFIAMSLNSVSHYLVLYTLAVTLGAIQCYTFILAFRPRSSIFDTLAHAYLPSALLSSLPRTTSDENSKDLPKTARATAMMAEPQAINNAIMHDIADRSAAYHLAFLLKSPGELRAMALLLGAFALLLLGMCHGKLLVTYDVGNTSIMVTVKTATFRHGNTSFSVSGPLRFCDGPNPSALADDVAGTVLVADYDAYGNAFAWARACQSRGCIGVVMLTRVNPTITSLEAWVETDRAASRNEQISAVPLVIIDGNDALTSMDNVRRLAGRVIATLDSSDIMDGTSASVAFGSAGVTAAFVVAWLVNVVNMAAAVYKFAAFAIDREGNLRAIPAYPCIVFSTALVSSTLRMLWFANAAFYSSQSFSKVFYRILITLFIPIGFAGTAAIGMAMHDHLNQGKTVSMQHKVTVYSLLSVLGIVFTVDIVGTFATAVAWHEYFDVTYLSSFYFLMNFPVSVLFIKYGIAVSNALLKNDNISTVERARSLQFARRVTISGVVGIVVLLSQVLFIAMSLNSVSHYLALYTLAVTLGAIQCYTFILAFRPRSSIFDTLAQAYLPSALLSSLPRTTSDEKSKNLPRTARATVAESGAINSAM
ncbi:hypothetical protein PBRA_007218 [Plasmodiophora brassicae]|nr:hypothetical protein PBRA_007218 [Plasmodiophora brassicae]